uniref:Large ribosomal subunit protein bL32c n=1 Tax=Adenophora stricta TaxID=82279 RepID=A0A2D0WTY7_9ASTR|nr:ribosomal protein L32 [Adenophora stricta]ARO35219.1 ribosomal protein L32 [Adenophora stricta]
MAVPKKRTSIAKKRIRKNIWKGKGYTSALKIVTGWKFMYNQTVNSHWLRTHPRPKGFGFLSRQSKKPL